MSSETLSLSNSSFFLFFFIFYFFWGGGGGVRQKIGEFTLFPAFLHFFYIVRKTSAKNKEDLGRSRVIDGCPLFMEQSSSAN